MLIRGSNNPAALAISCMKDVFKDLPENLPARCARLGSMQEQASCLGSASRGLPDSTQQFPRISASFGGVHFKSHPARRERRSL